MKTFHEVNDLGNKNGAISAVNQCQRQREGQRERSHQNARLVTNTAALPVGMDAN